MRNEQQYSDLIYEYFLSRFQFGYYKRGDTLPLVEALCREFGVAENTVKLALRRLRAQGYIDMRGGHATKVLFEQSEQECRDFIVTYYAKRRNAYADLSASAALIFVPLLLEGLRRIEGEELDQMSHMAERAKGDDLLHFYYLVMQRLQNPLAMNLLWETIFFWGFSFAGKNYRPAPYSAQTVREGIKELIDGANAQSWDSVRQTLLKFQHSDFCAVSSYLDRHMPRLPQKVQIPFVWRIYRDHPQICFRLSVQFLHEIYIGKYRNREYLPSYAVMAVEYGVSISTVRRTIAMLYAIGAVQPINGTGIRICPIGQSYQSADFSNAAIRRSLAFYVQGFDMIQLTCVEVIRDHVEKLSSVHRESLIGLLELERSSGRCVVSIFHVLRSIIDHHRLQAVQQVYEVLYGLFLWGMPLLKGTDQYAPCLMQMSEQFTEQMLQHLRKCDVEGCVTAMKELIDQQFAAAEKFLSQQGIYLKDLRTSSIIQFLVEND